MKALTNNPLYYPIMIRSERHAYNKKINLYDSHQPLPHQALNVLFSSSGWRYDGMFLKGLDVRLAFVCIYIYNCWLYDRIPKGVAYNRNFLFMLKVEKPEIVQPTNGTTTNAITSHTSSFVLTSLIVSAI